MFRLYKGKPTVEYFTRPAADTHTLQVGSAVSLDTAGVIRHLNNDSDDQILGVSAKLVASDVAGTGIPVLMAEENVVWEVETDSDGGASATDVGSMCAIDTGDTARMNGTVDVSDRTIPMFLITEVVSATKVRGRFARTALRRPAVTDNLDS